MPNDPSVTSPSLPPREAFIPLNRHDLIRLCLQDERLSAGDAEKFREFCDILAAYFHFKFHATLEAIKTNYAPFNPNVDVQSHRPDDNAQLEGMQDQLVQDFRHLLEKSNYLELSKGTLRRALEERSLVALRTDVDFQDFRRIVCYYRGDIDQRTEEKTILGRKRKRVIDIFERVVLLLQFKKEAYFLKKGIDPATLNYIPGKIYLYFYKNVPKYDLELLFPNVKTSMTWKDRLLLLVPAIGAGVGLIIRVLPQLLLIIAALLFILQIDIPGVSEQIQGETAEIQDGGQEKVLAVLVATLSLVVTLGGFAAKQYSSYKSKKIKFQKNVTDALFFRSMANHSAVFQLLVDVAEEEECKEVILAYYHLLISPHALTADELDRTVEQWMHQHLKVNIDFEIRDALAKLQRLRERTNGGEVSSLVTGDPTQALLQPKRYRALPIAQAREVVDRLWDNAFRYSH